MMYLLQVSTCWILFYGIYALYLKTETFFSINRLYLLASLGLGLLIPILGTYLPANTASTEVYAAMQTITITDIVIEEQSEEWTWQHIVIGIYLVGLAVSLIRLGYGINKIWHMYKLGVKTRKSDYVLVNSPKPHLPFSFFKWVFVSDMLPLQEDVAVILDHERLHVSQWHSVDILLTELLQCFFWFNPILSLYKQALRQSHEYLADAYVTDTREKYSYGQLLLGQSSSGLEIALANQFFNSQIKKRITMMYQERSSRPAMIKYLAAIPVLAILLMVFSSHSLFDHSIEFDREAVRSEVIDYFNNNSLEVNTVSTYIHTLSRKYEKHRNELSDILSELSPIKGYTMTLTPEGEKYSMCVNYENNNTNTVSTSEVTVKEDPIIVVNGKIIGKGKALMDDINPDDIQSVNVIKGQAAIDKYGPDATGGVIEITLKSQNKANETLIIIDDKTVGRGMEIFNTLDQDNIQSVSILKGDDALDKYGPDAADGVMEITMKKVGSQIDNDVYQVVTEMPRYPGCEDLSLSQEELKNCAQHKMLTHVYTNIKYPKEAREKDIQGMVVIEMIVDKNGNVTNPKVVRSIGGGCDEAALEVVQSFPTWIPGKQDGKPVNVKYVLPIKFVLEGSASEEVSEADQNKKELVTVVGKGEKATEKKEQYQEVDKKAKFPGTTTDEESSKALINKIFSTVKYPQVAKDHEIEGTVVAQFDISKEGYITDHRILRSIGWGLDEEVAEVIEELAEMEPWTPALKDGKDVAMQWTLPIKFKLQDSDKPSSKLELEGPVAYPNPSNGVFTIKYDSPSKAPSTITIYDELGRVLRIYDSNIGPVEIEVDLTLLNVTTAILNISQDGSVYTKKVMMSK